MTGSDAQHLDITTIQGMLTQGACELKGACDTLSRLDAATGDGDHGTAMSKVAQVLESTCATWQDEDLASFFNTLGWAVMGTNSGSTGPLFGSFFLGMSEGIAPDHLSPTDLAAVLENGLLKLRELSKAQVGDKTLLDALVPAIESIRASANAGDDVASILHAGATAAANGAEATKDMQAKFGRAKNIGERSIGHVDPGATSVALLFSGFEKGFTHGRS